MPVTVVLPPGTGRGGAGRYRRLPIVGRHHHHHHRCCCCCRQYWPERTSEWWGRGRTPPARGARTRGGLVSPQTRPSGVASRENFPAEIILFCLKYIPILSKPLFITVRPFPPPENADRHIAVQCKLGSKIITCVYFAGREACFRPQRPVPCWAGMSARSERDADLGALFTFAGHRTRLGSFPLRPLLIRPAQLSGAL